MVAMISSGKYSITFCKTLLECLFSCLPLSFITYVDIDSSIFQVSPNIDFLFTIIGGSYHVMNPVIYYYFNKSFRTAAKSYFREEVSVYRTDTLPNMTTLVI